MVYFIFYLDHTNSPLCLSDPEIEKNKLSYLILLWKYLYNDRFQSVSPALMRQKTVCNEDAVKSKMSAAMVF